MFDIAINNFFHVKLLIVWKMNSEKFDGIYFQVNMFYITDCQLDPFQGRSPSNFSLRKDRHKPKYFD